jgi:hypothetical protein
MNRYLRTSHSHPTCAHRTHYQIFFNEKGITTGIDRIRSFPKVIAVLIETVSSALSYDTLLIATLILSVCSFTTVTEVRMVTPQRECREYIIVRRSRQAGGSGICKGNKRQ